MAYKSQQTEVHGFNWTNTIEAADILEITVRFKTKARAQASAWLLRNLEEHSLYHQDLETGSTAYRDLLTQDGAGVRCTVYQYTAYEHDLVDLLDLIRKTASGEVIHVNASAVEESHSCSGTNSPVPSGGPLLDEVPSTHTPNVTLSAGDGKVAVTAGRTHVKDFSALNRCDLDEILAHPDLTTAVHREMLKRIQRKVELYPDRFRQDDYLQHSSLLILSEYRSINRYSPTNCRLTCWSR